MKTFEQSYNCQLKKTFLTLKNIAIFDNFCLEVILSYN